MRSMDQMFFSPTHPFGATGNVIVCGSLAIFGLVMGITTGRPAMFVMFILFGAMEIFGFVPAMRKVYAQRRRAREATTLDGGDVSPTQEGQS